MKKLGIIAGVIVIVILGIKVSNSGSESSVAEQVEKKYSLEQVLSKENDTERFKQNIAGKIGNHIYYSYDLFDEKCMNDELRKQIESELETIDNKIEDDLWIFNWYNYKYEDTGNLRSYYSAYLMIDGIVDKSEIYSTNIDDMEPNIFIKDKLFRRRINTKKIDHLMRACDFFEKLESYEASHAKELYHEDNYMGIEAKYILCYSRDYHKLVYEFEVNKYSKVIFSASTGEELYTEWWNGEMIE